MNHRNNNQTVRIGKAKKRTTVTISNTKSGIKIIRSVIIKNVLTIIPITLEKPTKPWRYSFFKGLKKVFRKRGRENSSKKALFKDLKKPIISIGASKYQNFKKTKGKKR